jgi:hypothetical protein
MSTSDIPVTAAQIAKMAGVQPSAVSNWRRRHEDFPSPMGRGPRGGDLFSREAVTEWLTRHGHTVTDVNAGERVFALLDPLRRVAATDDAIRAALSWLAAADAMDDERLSRVRDYLASGDVRRVLDELSVATGGRFDRLWWPAREQPELAYPALVECLQPMPAEERASTYEALIRGDKQARWTTESGTNPDLAQLLVDLAGPLDGVVVDPAVGTGDLLLTAARAAEKTGTGDLVLVGETVNADAAVLSTARLAMHGLASDIRLENSLISPSLERGLADTVLCDPPLNLRLRSNEIQPDDPRWFAGTPPKSSGDMAWLQHALWLTKPGSGRAIVVTAPGATFQGGRVDQIRRALISRGMVEAVIALPSGSAGPRTAIGLTIWILSWPEQSGSPRNVVFVDATTTSPSRHPLNGEARARIVACIAEGRARTALDDRGPVVVGPGLMAVSVALGDDILGPDQTLEPRAWVGEVREEVIQANLDEVAEQAGALVPAIMESVGEGWSAASRFTFHAVPDIEIPEPHRLGDLIDEGAIELLTGTRLPSDAFVDEGVMVARATRYPSTPPRYVDPDAIPGDVLRTREGDVVVHPRPANRPPMVTTATSDGQVVVYPLIILRPRQPWLPSGLLATAVDAGAKRAFATHAQGTTVRKVRRWLRDVTVPRLSATDAAAADSAIRATEELEDRIRMASEAIAQWRSMTSDVLASGRVRVHNSEQEER